MWNPRGSQRPQETANRVKGVVWFMKRKREGLIPFFALCGSHPLFQPLSAESHSGVTLSLLWSHGSGELMDIHCAFNLR